MNNKLNIEEIKYLIPDYITGTLDDNNKIMIETALSQSQELKDFYNEVKSTFDFVNTVKFQEPPPQYWNNLLPRIHQRIDERQERKTARNPLAILWKILVPVAAVLLIFIIYQLATSPEKQIVNKDNQNNIEKKESKDSDIEKSLEKESSIANENNPDNEINDDNSSTDDNNIPKSIIKIQKEQYDVNDYENTAENTNNGNMDNEIKENAFNTGDKEEIASVDVDETAILNASQGTGFDEDIEKDLNKLDDNEQNHLLEQLSKSNL